MIREAIKNARFPLLTHSITFGFPLALMIVVLFNRSLVSWHAVFMAIAYVCLLSEGILAFNSQTAHAVLTPYHKRLNRHSVLMIGAFVSAAVGLLVIYTDKEISGRPHFACRHEKLGMMTVGFTGAMVLAGTIVRYAHLFNLPPQMNITEIKLGHSKLGLCLYIMATMVILSGLQTDWFLSHVDPYICGCLYVAVVLLDLIVNVRVILAVNQKEKDYKSAAVSTVSTVIPKDS